MIDPIGLALENFDHTGRWREMDGPARIDATGQLADRIPIDVVYVAMFYATDGNLWLVDQPSRLRHGFIRVELPGST